MTSRQIVLSEQQGNIDWKEMKGKDLGQIILRAGYGAGVIDLQFRKNADGCMREGIKFRVYWHSYACTPKEAEDEADYCAETIAEYPVQMPIYYVLGTDSLRYAQSRGAAISQSWCAALGEAFCKRADELGYMAIYEENLDNLQSFLRNYPSCS